MNTLISTTNNLHFHHRLKCSEKNSRNNSFIFWLIEKIVAPSALTKPASAEYNIAYAQFATQFCCVFQASRFKWVRFSPHILFFRFRRFSMCVNGPIPDLTVLSGSQIRQWDCHQPIIRLLWFTQRRRLEGDQVGLRMRYLPGTINVCHCACAPVCSLPFFNLFLFSVLFL